jgi:beta-N-acetylhexosaminidase
MIAPTALPLPAAVGELLLTGFDGVVLAPATRRALERHERAGVVLFRRNVPSLEETRALTSAIAEAAARSGEPLPALVAIDQEGGRVTRLPRPFPSLPPMRVLARGGDRLVRDAARVVGRGLAHLGIDLDLAPVLDVDSNPANPVIGDRAFGREPEAVARRALAFARGLASAGVLPCGKHFPGHGDTHADSHRELPRVAHDRDRLTRIELLPFARAAAASLPMLMTAHVVFDALDPAHPATMSAPILTGLLRRQLGYRGVIVSDDLTMRAIAGRMDPGIAAASAIQAGCDVLLICRDEPLQAAAEAGLIRAAERSAALRHRISESAARVRALKRAHAAHQRRLPPPPPTVIGQFEHRRLADRLAGR